MKNETILLVDDEKGLLKLVETILQKEGFQHIVLTMTAAEALTQISRRQFDVIILDVMLPDMDGFELCREIRKTTTTPILFLTARSSDFDKLTGLALGGDDYITKPFNPLEVVARIQVQLRRQRMNRNQNETSVGRVFDYGAICINKDEGRITRNGTEVACTSKEFELLAFLCENPNRVFTVQQLYERVWGPFCNGDDKTVVIHISRLRKKLENDPKQPDIIVNLRGIGYKFIPPSMEGER
ncbi:response regulator transcription factor [Brevibacillus brevis]|uniref:response regulator transcription factor n=1 Tax=Brevibacillus brevis TaxID=1393 RepID=UPI0037CC03E8